MKIQRFNWPIWAGFLLSLFAVLSYPFVFVRWPFRAFATERPQRSKIAALILTTLSAAVLGFFVFSFFIASRWLPAAKGAPQVGQKAPEFLLADINNKNVSLAELLSSPLNGKPAKGVLLIFYRGYW
jgi:4-amino-4-deoxy-L-arabinose transferase-like glycosyltransferase